MKRENCIKSKRKYIHIFFKIVKVQRTEKKKIHLRNKIENTVQKNDTKTRKINENQRTNLSNSTF